MRRVPTLVVDDGEVVIESAAILDCLDGMVGPARAMMPPAGAGRRRALKTCALATGLADKSVSLVYERVLHAAPSPAWIGRCRAQIGDVLGVLEASRAAVPTPFWMGASIGHADIAVARALRFLGDAHADLLYAADIPALRAHATRCQALQAFQATAQPFIPPA